MYRVSKTTDNQHIGEMIEFIEAGNVVTFADGDVIAVDQIFTNEGTGEVIAVGQNYQMTLIKEQ
jgi:hypothetical protein